MLFLPLVACVLSGKKVVTCVVEHFLFYGQGI
jgi:hypothetical protein